MFVIEKINLMIKELSTKYKVSVEEVQSQTDDCIYEWLHYLGDDLMDFDLSLPLEKQLDYFFEDLSNEFIEIFKYQVEMNKITMEKYNERF